MPLFADADNNQEQLYQLFQNPSSLDRPFVRWWWNGDKINKEEISRELHLLKEAGFGGVEINPIKFPANTKDKGNRSVKWLSTEWVDILHYTLDEAKSLGLICDLIVGSGWPFGAEWLQGDERTQMVSIAVKRIEGPIDYEVSVYELFHEADPAVTSPYSGRTMALISLHLIPSLLNKIEDAKDISDKAVKGNINVSVPEGSYLLHALVSINGFMEVINGAPGADGPVLNHYNKATVQKYLDKMSSAIGDVSGKLRAFFVDSMELEGANWSTDMPDEFRKRRGYELKPWLPFILYKSAGMGNIFDYHYGAEFGSELKEKLNRIRYDFELTKTELLKERFTETFINWCNENKVKSRMQAYGRGYHPLDGSFGADIPECETWIKNGLGEVMDEEDYRSGRAYSMINKYVSSAAHLQDKKEISCEELTNTDRVFNETLELLKIASDQSIISGATHAVFHGFNYSPKEADFPGWVRYGTFFNERNTWWPYVHYFTAYRARLTAVLQQASMFADIAILSPVADMWSIYGAQNEPFPSLVHPSWQTLLWETIHKNGSGCDYVSEAVIQNSVIHTRYFQYGNRKYNILFLTEVESVEPATAKKMLDFMNAGGKIFCMEKYPDKSPGWLNSEARDKEVVDFVNKMKNDPDQFIILKKPSQDFVKWYKEIQDKFQLDPYVKIENPDPFINQVRYQTANEEIFFFINSNAEKEYHLSLTFAKEITYRKQAWIWNPENGERQMLSINSNKLIIDIEPAGSKLIVFDQARKGKKFSEPLCRPDNKKKLSNWSVEWQHIDGTTKHSQMDELKDVKDMPDFVSFCGTIIYRSGITENDAGGLSLLNLGKVYGVSEVFVNGKNMGVQWHGNRIYATDNIFNKETNDIEIRVITSMGNYMKTLKENPVAQYWTNEKRKDQPIQSMGLIGPVTLY
jgi:hypothetical protein